MSKKKGVCIICGIEFEKEFSTTQKTCINPSCILSNYKAKQIKEARVQRLLAREITLKDLQVKINEIVRLIDSGVGCISCGNTTNRMTAGHYHTAGQNKQIRFNLHNIHGQCWYNCNKNRHGNIPNYYKGLASRYGQEYADYVQGLNSIKGGKFSQLNIKECYGKAKEVINEIKGGSVDLSDKLAVRRLINERLFGENSLS